MRVVFRTDSSLGIGSGHVMRCLTLAERLRQQGAQVLFICRDLPGNVNTLIEQGGFELCCLPFNKDLSTPLDWNRHAQWLGSSWQQDAIETSKCLSGWGEPADWLIVDHYALDINWETELKSEFKKIMVIDDLADRRHDCDLLLDQNFFACFEMRYNDLVPDHCLKLLGPQYSLLRPDFSRVRENLRQRKGVINKILVFFGGSDPTDETTKALEAFQLLNRPDIHVDVIVGIGNQKRAAVKALCDGLPQVSYHCQINNMAEMLADTDLCLGAGGSTSWERFAMGTPSLLIAVADNQEEHLRDLDRAGLVLSLGRSDQVDRDKIVRQVKKLLSDPELLLRMEKSGLALVDCLGTQKVAEAVSSMCAEQ